jgi:hypothetical protein
VQTGDFLSVAKSSPDSGPNTFFYVFDYQTKDGDYPQVSFLEKYIHTYHSRFIPEGVAEVSQIFLRDTHVLPKLVSYEEHCRGDRW